MSLWLLKKTGHQSKEKFDFQYEKVTEDTLMVGSATLTFLVLLFVLSTWRDYSSLQGDTLLLNNNG